MLVLALLGCGDPPRRPLQFPIDVVPVPAAIALDRGVATLDEARVQIADLRFEGVRQAARWTPSLVASAHAHAGHDFAGDVRAELLGSWSVDLLGDPTALGIADAYEAEIATASFQLGGDPTVELRGTWQDDGPVLPFALTLSFVEPVAGVPFSAQLDADAPPAGVTLRFDPAHALSFIDWTDEDGDGALTPSDGTVENTTRFGLVSTASWTFEMKDGEP